MPVSRGLATGFINRLLRHGMRAPHARRAAWLAFSGSRRGRPGLVSHGCCVNPMWVRLLSGNRKCGLRPQTPPPAFMMGLIALGKSRVKTHSAHCSRSEAGIQRQGNWRFASGGRRAAGRGKASVLTDKLDAISLLANQSGVRIGNSVVFQWPPDLQSVFPAVDTIHVHRVQPPIGTGD